MIAGAKGAGNPGAAIGVGRDLDIKSSANDASPVGHGAYAESLVFLPVIREAGTVVLDPETDEIAVAGEPDGDGGCVPVLHGIADGLLGDAVQVKRTTLVVDQGVSLFGERT